MLKKTIAISVALMALSACASNNTPRIIQTMPGAQEVHLTSGIATQVEMPDNSRVQSVVIGNPSLATAEQSGNLVNLLAKSGSGETNMIIRSIDEDGRSHVDQYRVTVSDR